MFAKPRHLKTCGKDRQGTYRQGRRPLQTRKYFASYSETKHCWLLSGRLRRFRATAWQFVRKRHRSLNLHWDSLRLRKCKWHLRKGQVHAKGRSTKEATNHHENHLGPSRPRCQVSSSLIKTTSQGMPRANAHQVPSQVWRCISD